MQCGWRWNRVRSRSTAAPGGTGASPGSAPAKSSTPLHKAGLAPVARDDVAALTAWRQGRVVFRNTPLVQAIDEINRYAPRSIQLDDGTLAQTRIAGVFSTDNTQAFLDLLPTIAPVLVLQRPDGTPSIVRR